MTIVIKRNSVSAMLMKMNIDLLKPKTLYQYTSAENLVQYFFPQIQSSFNGLITTRDL